MQSVATAPQKAPTSPVLVIARHVVAWLAAYSIANAAIGRSFENWAFEVIGLALFAGAIAAALALFFTRGQAAKSRRNFIVALWTVGVAAMLGHWNYGRHQAMADTPAATAPGSQPFTFEEGRAPAR